jgi:hypothetical protein
MGYSFYLISKEKEISKEDFDIAMSNLSVFNRLGLYHVICFKGHYIRISGSYSISGKYVEGFVLNLLMCLLDLNYKPKVISHDWEYGTKEDWDWLNTKEKI